MTDMRATERLLEHIAEQADVIATLSPGVGELATAIHDAVDELQRRGDTFVRREDLRAVLRHVDPLGSDAQLEAALERLGAAIGGTL